MHYAEILGGGLQNIHSLGVLRKHDTVLFEKLQSGSLQMCGHA